MGSIIPDKGIKAGMALLLAVSALLIPLFAACVPSPAQSHAKPAEAGFPITITDQMGREVTIAALPQRIVALSPGNTEIVFALGLEDKLAGVTEFCDYPPEASEKPQVGGFNTVDIERVVAIQPDLILASDIHKDEALPRLEGLGLTVLAVSPENLDEVLDAITLIGRCTGAREQASQLTAGMQQRIESVTSRTAGLADDENPRVFYIVWHDPLMTVGSETIIHQLITLAGGSNIAGDISDDYPTLDMEAVIEADPQIIIAGSDMGEGASLPYQFALTEERFSLLSARADNRIYEIETDLVGRPGPRIVDGLEDFAELLHPELFGER